LAGLAPHLQTLEPIAKPQKGQTKPMGQDDWDDHKINNIAVKPHPQLLTANC
jgi:hypothetical protein